MRNLKKFLALVLAMLMVVSAAATVSAFDDVAEDNQYADAIYALVDMGVITGKTAETFAPEESVTRWQMALMMARALNPEAPATMWSEGLKIFTDVEGAHQYPGSIAWAYTNNIVTGIGGGLFAPNNGITYGQALIMAVRALGYEVVADSTVIPYWINAYALGAKLGLTANITGVEGDDALTRAETAQILYNMLYAPLADGESFAALLYGEKGTSNVTTFVITATANQSYTGDTVVNDDYVAIQELGATGLLGKVVFVKAADLGIENPDAYIGYSVDLINYEDGEFDAYEINEAKVITNANAAAVAKTTKATIDGTTYYVVDEYTNNPLKNEIIILDDTGRVSGAAHFYFNKAGNIVDANDETKVLAYKLDNITGGESLYARADEYAKDDFRIYTLEELADLKTAPSATVTDGFSAMANTDLTGAFQLTLFNDDDDAEWERAIYTPIAMSVYTAPSSTAPKPHTTKGLFEKVESGETSVAGAVTSLSAGDVFVYTYNKQSGVINVIEKLEVLTGEVTKIDATDIANKNVKIYIDGEAYYAGMADKEATMGAKLFATTTPATNVADIKTNKHLSYFSYTDFILNTKPGNDITYYAYNDYIIHATVKDPDTSFDIIVMDEIAAFTDEVYVDIYEDGVEVPEVVLAKIDGKVLDELNDWRLAQLLGKETLFYPGLVYKANYNADGELLVGDKLNPALASSIANFKLNKAVSGDIEFLGGISEADVKGDRIRTNDSTVFYFIENYGTPDAKVRTWTEGIDEATIYADNNTIILADKIGYGTDTAKNGTASVVFVFDAVSVEGFGIKAAGELPVYVSAVTANKVTIDSAANFGLDTKIYNEENYDSDYFYHYAGVGINLDDGSAVKDIYSSTKLTAKTAYVVDDNGVVIPGKSVALVTEVDTVVDTDNSYITATNIPVKLSDKVTDVVAVVAGSATVYTGAEAAKKANADGYTVSYLDNNGDHLKDGILVLVVDAPAPAPEKDVYTTFEATADAEFEGRLNTYDVNVTREDATFTVILLDEEGTEATGNFFEVVTEYDTAAITGMISTASENANGVVDVTGITANVKLVDVVIGTDVDDKDITGKAIAIDLTAKDIFGDDVAYEFEEGEKYQIAITVQAGATGNPCVFTYKFVA